MLLWCRRRLLQVTYKRLQDTLSVLSAPGGGSSVNSERLPGLSLIDVMFGARQPQFAAATPKWKPNNTRLDESQVCDWTHYNTSLGLQTPHLEL